MLFVLFISPVVSSYAQELQRTTMQVGNLTCPSCLTLIEGKLKRVAGMTGIAADLRRGLVFADHSSSLSGDQIAGFITNLGYPAEVINQEVVSEDEILMFDRRSVSRCGVGGCNTGGCNATGDTWRKLFQRVVNSVNNNR